MSIGLLLACSNNERFIEGKQVFVNETYTHTVEAGDIIEVRVYGEESLSGQYKVNPQGKITYPFLGKIDVKGLKADQIRQHLVAGLKDGYLVKPDLAVEIISLKPVYILGEVKKPGGYPYSDELDIIRAIALAQGFTHRANEDSFQLIRKKDGVEKTYLATPSTELHPGDVVKVKERFF